MKRVFSLLILLVTLFIGFELIVNYFTKSYVNKYKIYSNDKVFDVEETYEKKINDKYDIKITVDDKEFYYIVNNTFNKQKKIIKDILIYPNGDDLCIYPILKNNKGTYIECNKKGSLYSSLAYDRNFINKVKNDLKEKKYMEEQTTSVTPTDANGSKVYSSNIPKKDEVILWKYKGIDRFNTTKSDLNYVLSFDKYENNTGALVGKYYIIPQYTRSNILEFKSVSLIDVTTMKSEKVSLGEYTLSSDTYINGVVDDKLYYTDPSNLLQIEINTKTKKARLIGSEKIGGQMYDGEWKNRNIYDFRNAKIKYTNLNDLSNYKYKDAKEGESCYYFVESNGNVYQVPKLHLDKKILLFNSKLNNFNVVGEDIYYVNNDTVYYYNIVNETKPILVNKDLIYNTANRISVYRDYSS